VPPVTPTAPSAPLSLAVTGDIAPDWPLGLSCGIGGLVGDYLGARLRLLLPETGDELQPMPRNQQTGQRIGPETPSA